MKLEAKTVNNQSNSTPVIMPHTSSRPNPEVLEKNPRRRFTAKYKLKILSQVDACEKTGELGALLRREGLYHSNIITWKRQREQGQLQGLSPKKRGRKRKEVNPLAKRVADLERTNKRLAIKLKQAEMIIDVQKKISDILGIKQPDHNEENS